MRILRDGVLIALASVIVCFVRPVFGCDEVSVSVSGTLSSKARFRYQAGEDRLTTSDTVIVDVPLSIIGADDSKTSFLFTRTDQSQWRVDMFQGFAGTSPTIPDFVGPTAMIDFDKDGNQSSTQQISLLPISGNIEATRSPVIVSFSSLRISSAESDITVGKISKHAAKCAELPKLISSKTKADPNVHDELNPYVGNEAERAYLPPAEFLK